jgi:uncharacterized protein (AIM24 family)
MDYKIEHGPVFTIVRISFKQGEQFRAEAGAMVSMTPTLKLEAKTTGKGLMGTLKAAGGRRPIRYPVYGRNRRRRTGPGSRYPGGRHENGDVG